MCTTCSHHLVRDKGKTGSWCLNYKGEESLESDITEQMLRIEISVKLSKMIIDSIYKAFSLYFSHITSLMIHLVTLVPIDKSGDRMGIMH